MKRYIKKIIIALILVFIGIQFMPKNYNKNTKILTTDFITQFNPPKKIKNLLKTSCYDCHSNNTKYPWYSNIQPMAWLMENHIKDGKKELNFSEFTNYSKRRQKTKLKSIASQIRDNKMPLFSYTLVHRDAIISDKDRQFIEEWFINTKDNLNK